jgi:general secretion pathway protein J
MKGQDTKGDRGLTLIELLAAMAILAVVSLMAVQTITGALFQREILERADAQGAQFVRALALLRRDLEAAVPVPLGIAEEGPLPVFEATPDGFTLMRAGLGEGPGTIGRVDWRVSAGGDLSRRITLAGEAGPAVTVLSGVRALRIAPLNGILPNAAEPLTLPGGFELTFEHAGQGSFRLVVAR